MYSSGLKKLGNELGLTAGRGRIYGTYEGFPICMWDGAGTKSVQLALGTPKGAEELRALLPKGQEAYRIVGINVMEGAALALFTFGDTIGTLKRLRAFLQEALPALRAAGLSQGYHCVQCGEGFSGTVETGVIKGLILPVHGRCLAGLHQQMQQEKEAQAAQLRQESAEALRDGSIFKGIIGAFFGALIGSIPWVAIYLFGYVTSLGGILIGAGAVYGYKKLSGRVGIACVVSAVAFAILMVPLATYAGEAASLVKELLSSNGLPFQMSDFGWLFRSITDMEGWKEVYRQNVLQGYLYAAIGLICYLAGSRASLRNRPSRKA